MARSLDRWRAKNVVLDPVIEAKSGTRLLSRSALASLRRDLLPLACSLSDAVVGEMGDDPAVRRTRNSLDRRTVAAL